MHVIFKFKHILYEIDKFMVQTQKFKLQTKNISYFGIFRLLDDFLHFGEGERTV